MPSLLHFSIILLYFCICNQTICSYNISNLFIRRNTMKFTKLLCIMLALCTVFALASCGSKENGGAETTPAGSTTPEVTNPKDTTPEDTDPVQSSSEDVTEPPVTAPSTDIPEDFVVPADGVFSLGNGENGLSFPFAAGVLTGLTGDNFAVASMGKLDNINWFTKVVNPIGGFTGNWQLTSDSTLSTFTAGGYGDIQMFYHIDANNDNWVFAPFASKGQAIVIRFTAPADGTYTYTVKNGRDWTASSGGAVMDVHIGENMHNWWDMFRFAGNQHGAYVAEQVSSAKELAAGTNVYFIIRAQGMDTISAIGEFIINYTPAA